jgi:nucleolar pre-ribosomal-associated protein 1
MDEFRPHGIHICRTLLQPLRLKLISRNLTANNEYIISPSLRLLTEVVSFDGGSQAKLVNTHREFTFKGLGRSLNWTSLLKSSGAKKETVRTAALRFLLANFKFQNALVKSDLAGQRDIVSALFKNIQEDPPDVIVNILGVLKQEFLLDKEVQRSAKSRLLTPWALGRLAALYSYVGPADDGNTMEKSVETAVHDFLLLVCTTPGLGVLLPDSGWYPSGFDVRHAEVDKNLDRSQGVDFLEHIGLELDYLEESNKYRERIPVRNSTLSTFIQGLRPYANILQSQLLLAVFKAAPELVADYYILKRSFSFEPKLTTTWIGYSALLFSTIQLPTLEYCGRQEGFSNLPPPIPIVIESILPQPLNQRILTKCLNQKTKLIKFFVIRLLCVAFQKLRAVLDIFGRASIQVSALWKQASSKLLQEFCRRCPKMKDIITAFRSTAEEDVLQREAVARLLAVYYGVIPDIAVNERFDVSVALGNVLRRIETSSDTAEDLGMRMLELEHLLSIAQCSPNIRWWNKPGRPTKYLE